MANKTLTGRSQQKRDTAANWAKATNFVPLSGEIIIYTDGEGGAAAPKIKIGDGTSTINKLPFVTDLNEAISVTEVAAADIALSGNINDLVQTENDYVIFKGGSSTINI